jgi:hypothetical protein
MRPGHDNDHREESTGEGHLLHRARTLADRSANARDLHHVIPLLKRVSIQGVGPCLRCVRVRTWAWTLTLTLTAVVEVDVAVDVEPIVDLHL